ncbi:STS14 protein [Typha latifolia]|uniref:STS14 protein n=1 Tax=Typha latifolia TaxID=4733 RepID=UPI003C2B0C48
MMGSQKSLGHLLVLIWVVAMALCGVSPVLSRVIPAAPPKAQPNATDQFLIPHNQARAAVGVGPLNWSGKLVAEASKMVGYQKQYKACDFADLDSSLYGANQGWSSYPARPDEVVGSWVEEEKYYYHANNTCAAGHDCGTYTQVVWRKTVELGCAQATCVKGGATITVCLYYPHGNVKGQSPY